MTALLETTLMRAGHIRVFEVSRAAVAGWEVSERDDHRVTHQHYSDWHRVEYALTQLTAMITELRKEGWTEA